MEKRTAAIVLAGGRGTRMGSDVPKQYMDVDGYPLIWYSLKAFEDSSVDEIVLVCPQGDEENCSTNIVEKYGFSKVKGIVPGGLERYHSVYNALKSLRCIAEGDMREPCEIVFIHDGARPMIDGDTIKRAYDAAVCDHAAIVAVPANDTVKMADTAGFATETLRRDLVWLVQTPQVFDFYEIYEAYGRLMESEDELRKKGILITDDAMVLELFSDRRVRVVEGDRKNIKVTGPDAIETVKHFLSLRNRNGSGRTM